MIIYARQSDYYQALNASCSELVAALGLSDRKSFRERYLLPALEGGLIEMTIPEKPNSRLQKHRLVEQKYFIVLKSWEA